MEKVTVSSSLSIISSFYSLSLFTYLSLPFLSSYSLYCLCSIELSSRQWIGNLSSRLWGKVKSFLPPLSNLEPCQFHHPLTATAINVAMKSIRITGKGVHILDSHMGFLYILAEMTFHNSKLNIWAHEREGQLSGRKKSRELRKWIS